MHLAFSFGFVNQLTQSTRQSRTGLLLGSLHWDRNACRALKHGSQRWLRQYGSSHHLVQLTWLHCIVAMIFLCKRRIMASRKCDCGSPGSLVVQNLS